MGNKGTFDLPTHTTQSTKGARMAYKNMWQREWPHEDTYLRELAARVQDEYLPQHDTMKWGKCGTLLNAMRENHVFEDDKPKAGDTCQPLQDHMNHSFGR